jgi:large subunit ribosomal protein L4
MAGEQVGTTELPDAIFRTRVNTAVMHQALMRQLANARAGTHETKTRGQVSGSTKKVWRQKGTGRARQGSRKAPHWRGGGTVFGPHPRSYEQKMPRKMRRLALRSALSAKAAGQQIRVVDVLQLDRPRTKDIVAMLRALTDGAAALIVLPERNGVIEKSADNLPNVKVLLANYLNVRDLLGYDHLILPVGAVPVIASFLDESGQEPDEEASASDAEGQAELPLLPVRAGVEGAVERGLGIGTPPPGLGTEE